MTSLVADAKQRWAVAAVAATVVALVGVSIFRAPAPAGFDATATSPRVIEFEKVRPNATPLSEETVIRDLAPLFLPTARNASLPALPMREPDRTFMAEETLRLGIADTGWRFDEDFPPVVTLNGRPVSAAKPLDDLQATAPAAPLLGFGRREEAIAPMKPRGAFIEIVATATGQRILGEPVGETIRPPTDKLWQPVEFLASVGPAGLVSPLTLSTRSGVEEVDVFFRNYLARTFRIGERLAPGFYRITVAP